MCIRDRDKAHEMIEFTDYEDLYAKYDTLTKISFDYAVAEKEPDISVMRFAGQWKDLGTWNTLTEAMEDSCIGDAMLNESCENVHVINEMDVPVLCMGLKLFLIHIYSSRRKGFSPLECAGWESAFLRG